MGFSTAVKNQVLNKLFRATDFTPDATLYVGLSTTQPVDDGTGVTEPVGGSYAREAVTNDATEWSAAAAGVKTNLNDIAFTAATGSWGTVGWFVIYDALTGGNMLYWGTIQTPRTIASGDEFTFPAGDLVITLASD